MRFLDNCNYFIGALGPVDGLNPELSNLTCSITEVNIYLLDVIF